MYTVLLPDTSAVNAGCLSCYNKAVCPMPHFRTAISLVYTRVLTRVQLTSGREPSSNPPMDVG